MGGPMARHLASAGHDVRAWNRTREKAEGLGAEVAATPAEAVAGAGLVLTMLADGPAVEATMREALPRRDPGRWDGHALRAHEDGADPGRRPRAVVRAPAGVQGHAADPGRGARGGRRPRPRAGDARADVARRRPRARRRGRGRRLLRDGAVEL